jgi:peptidoglycan/LPS O-acetylase OafA/YrhL
MSRSERNEAIDCLRGISIVLVVLFHIGLRIPLDTGPIGQVMPSALFNALFRSGYYAVIMFFVISGFLITGTTLRRWGALSKVAIGRFYLLRFARIAPCLAALLVLLAALHLLVVTGFVITSTSLARALFSAATFQLNWLEAATGYLPGAWDVLWSLSVEEAFYLAFPLLALAARRAWLFVTALLVLVGLGPFARTVFTDNEIWADKSYLAGADAIALGCLAALAAGKLRQSRTAPLLCLAAGLSLFLLVFVFRRETAALGLTALGLNVTVLAGGLALLLVALDGLRFAPSVAAHRLTAPLRWFGRNSYEVYLTHMIWVTPAGALFTACGQPPAAAPFWLLDLLILCGLSGDIVARVLSQPANRAIRALGRAETAERTEPSPASG